MDCSGRPPRVQPAQQGGLEDLQRVGRGRRAAAGPAHLGRPGSADEGVPEVQRHLAAEDRRHQFPADGEAGPGRGVVDPGGLERHVLVGPPHRPVDLPGQLPGHVGDRHGTHHRAAGAGIGDLRGLVVEAGHGGVVPAAGRAVGPERVVDRGLRPVIVVLIGWQRVGALGAVPGQDRADVGAPPHGEHDLLRVRAGGVHLGLADLGDLDPEQVQRFAQGLLEVLGEVLVLAARVGHAGQRTADVLLERVGHPERDAAQPVVVVPGQDVPARSAVPPHLVRDQVRGHELAQVPQVHRPGRADPRRAGRNLTGMPALALLAHLGRRARHPVFGRSHGIRPPPSFVRRHQRTSNRRGGRRRVLTAGSRSRSSA